MRSGTAESRAGVSTTMIDTSTDPQVGYRPPGPLVADPLGRYLGPFTRRHAAHLMRRAGFGGTPSEIDALVALGTGDAIDSVIHPRQADIDFAEFPEADLIYDKKIGRQTAQSWYVDRMLRTRHPLAEKMTLFWHGHFATSIYKVPPVLMVEQIDLFRDKGLGNFHALLYAVTVDPAMLVWLDNRFNNKAHANENFAREVMELFALGLGQYGEDDVHAAARAFTGWTLDRTNHAIFRPTLHDSGEKTLLGRTGNFGADEAVAIIVAQPAHQRFICRKLLEYLLYSDPEPELTEALAATYALNGYDIGLTVGTLLRSKVFFSQRAYRALPKSPIEFTIGLLRFMGMPEAPSDTVYWMGHMGQIPLAPPNVKGWDGGPTWINTATLLARFNYVNRMVRSSPSRPGAPMAGSTPTPTFTPDLVVAAAGGLDPDRVLAALARSAMQDDVTSDIRTTLIAYLDSSDATVPTPLSGENYEDKIRGALALVLNLPANQLN